MQQLALFGAVSQSHATLVLHPSGVCAESLLCKEQGVATGSDLNVLNIESVREMISLISSRQCHLDDVVVTGASESAITDMQAYMDMLNPDIGSRTPKKDECPPGDTSDPPPPPAYPPPPPPESSQEPPPPPGYPAPQPHEEEVEASSAEFLKVKSNLRHVESSKREVRGRGWSLSFMMCLLVRQIHFFVFV